MQGEALFQLQQTIIDPKDSGKLLFTHLNAPIQYFGEGCMCPFWTMIQYKGRSYLTSFYSFFSKNYGATIFLFYVNLFAQYVPKS